MAGRPETQASKRFGPRRRWAGFDTTGVGANSGIGWTALMISKRVERQESGHQDGSRQRDNPRSPESQGERSTDPGPRHIAERCQEATQPEHHGQDNRQEHRAAQTPDKQTAGRITHGRVFSGWRPCRVPMPFAGRREQDDRRDGT